MFEIILFVFGAIGLSHILVDSKITAPIREWLAEPTFSFEAIGSWFLNIICHPVKSLTSCLHSIVTCYQCSGFWCGVFCGYALFGWPTWFSTLHLLAAGGAGSFLSMFAAAYLNYLEAKTLVDLPPENEDKSE